MQDLQKLLKAHRFFKDLDPEYFDLIVGCASNAVFKVGEHIFREKQPADHFYVLRSGTVALEWAVQGNPPLIVQTVGAGEILGWSWLFPPHYWKFDARTVVLARAIAIDGRCVRNKCEENPGLGYELMRRLAHVIDKRLHATMVQLLDVYGKEPVY